MVTGQKVFTRIAELMTMKVHRHEQQPARRCDADADRGGEPRQCQSRRGGAFAAATGQNGILQHPAGQNILGALLMQGGRLPDALKAFDLAVRMAPQFADAHSNRGVLLQRMGRLDDALAAYDAAVQAALESCYGAVQSRECPEASRPPGRGGADVRCSS